MLPEKLTRLMGIFEAKFGVSLTEADFTNGHADVERISFHTACRLAVYHGVPWLQALDEVEHTTVTALLARFLEVELGADSGMSVRTTAEFLEELNLCPVSVSPEVFEHLMGVWTGCFWQEKDLAGMATYVLAYLRHGEVIYHILPKKDWEEAQRNGAYTPESMTVEGFIHCSEVHQVVRVANAYYSGESDLYLLCIAVERVRPEIRYESPIEGGELFPHIYGPLTLDAVAAAAPLDKDDEGHFIFPTGPQALEK